MLMLPDGGVYPELHGGLIVDLRLSYIGKILEAVVHHIRPLELRATRRQPFKFRARWTEQPTLSRSKFGFLTKRNNLRSEIP